MDLPATDRRTVALISGIVIAVLAVGSAPLLAAGWGSVIGDEYATFEDSLLGAALVCIPALAVGIALWRWGRRGAVPPGEGAPLAADIALGLSIAAVAAPWLGALAAGWEGFFAGVLGAAVLGIAGAGTALVARSRSPHGSVPRRRATVAAWVASTGWAVGLVAATAVVIAIVRDLE